MSLWIAWVSLVLAQPVLVEERDVLYSFSMPDNGEATFGDAGTVKLTVSYTQVESGGGTPEALDRFYPMPESADKRWCELKQGDRVIPGWNRPGGCTLVGAPALLDGQREIRWGWTVAHAPAAGVVDLQDEHRLTSSTVRLEGADIVATGGDGTQVLTPTSGVGFSAVNVPERPHDEVEAIPAYTVGWRVTAAGGKDVIASRDSLLMQINKGALAASLPEPGLGLGFKGRKSDVSAVPEVLAKVRLQVTRGALPGVHPLKPRRLMSVRRSRWATPWEQAVLLTRYLGQLKIAAMPIPVRPRPMGQIEEAVPHGYVEAVVRVDTEDGPVWIDPACSVCGVGQMRPELWGGQALAVGMDQIPAAQRARRVQSIDLRGDKATVSIELGGAQALRLRMALASVPIERRAATVPRLVGFEGATLDEHTGISDRGSDIELHLTLPADQGEVALGMGLPVIARQGSVLVDLGWPLERIDRVLVDADAPAWADLVQQQVDAGGMSWSRSVSIEGGVRTVSDRWLWTHPTVPRADAVRVLGASQDGGQR